MLYDPNNPPKYPPPMTTQQGPPMRFHDPYNQPVGPQYTPDGYYVPNYFQGEQAKMYFERISAEYGPGGAFGNMLQSYGGKEDSPQEQYSK
jgi:hypothetical protein